MCGIFGYVGEPPRELLTAAALAAAVRGPHAHGWARAEGEVLARVVRPGRLGPRDAEALPASGPVIGHCRLSTSGRTCAVTELGSAQPLVSGELAISHNGVLRNWRDVAGGRPLVTDNDSEALFAVLAEALADGAGEAVAALGRALDGRSPHALLVLWRGSLFGARLPGTSGPAHPLHVVRGREWAVIGSRSFAADAKPVPTGRAVFL